MIRSIYRLIRGPYRYSLRHVTDAVVPVLSDSPSSNIGIVILGLVHHRTLSETVCLDQARMALIPNVNYFIK